MHPSKESSTEASIPLRIKCRIATTPAVTSTTPLLRALLDRCRDPFAPCRHPPLHFDKESFRDDSQIGSNVSCCGPILHAVGESVRGHLRKRLEHLRRH